MFNFVNCCCLFNKAVLQSMHSDDFGKRKSHCEVSADEHEGTGVKQ